MAVFFIIVVLWEAGVFLFLVFSRVVCISLGFLKCFLERCNDWMVERMKGEMGSWVGGVWMVRWMIY